jgi:gliding motility-associated-like protein
LEDQALCLDNLPLVVSAETGMSTDAYLWSTGATTASIEINTIGSFNVTITTIDGCSNSASFTLVESETATIEFTETVDFSAPNNSITIDVSGIGNYLFQLDNGLPQTSNIFENVSYGAHLVTVIDQLGCNSVTKEVIVFDIPLFFTPNDDLYNDTWHVIGVEELEGTIVYIFDRYGKLLKTLSHSSPGWNGFYNGYLMPTSDYWYVANIKQGEKEFELKGHFTLKH